MACLFLWIAVYTRAPLLVGAQTRAFDTLELELQVVYRRELPVQVLGTKLGSSASAVHGTRA